MGITYMKISKLNIKKILLKRLGNIRATIRFVLFILAMLLFISRLLITRFFTPLKVEIGIKHRQQFCNVLLPILGIQITKKGKSAYDNVLFIANHRSYIDPFVLVTHFDALALAKIEVRSWPIIGFGVKITGTYFVKRAEKSSRQAAREGIANTIKNGHSILLFPEGTTSDLPTTLPFKPRTFQMAADNQIKVIPIAIEFQDPKDAWIGTDTFIRHFFQTFAKPTIVCEVHYGLPMWEADGTLLKTNVQSWINQELSTIRTKWGLSN